MVEVWVVTILPMLLVHRRTGVWSYGWRGRVSFEATAMTLDYAAFWEGRHKASDSYMLGGTVFDHMIQHYDLTVQHGCGLQVTEIGVGLGHCVRGFMEHGATVCAVDVCPAALSGLPDGCRTLLVDRIHEAPEADLAICHLVFQHIPLHEVARILSCVPLKDGGLFCFQTSSGPENTHSDEVCAGSDGYAEYTRSESLMDWLCALCGLRVVWKSLTQVFPEYGTRWMLWKAVQA